MILWTQSFIAMSDKTNDGRVDYDSNCEVQPFYHKYTLTYFRIDH